MTTDKLYNDLFKDYPNQFRSLHILRSKVYAEYHSLISELLKKGTLKKDALFIWWNDENENNNKQRKLK